MVEFGTSSEIKGEDPSFEIITAFSFGQQTFEIPEEIIDEEPIEEAAVLEAEQEQLNEEEAIREDQRKQDSLAAVEAAEILALEQLQNQKSKDSIATVNQQIELAKAKELEEKRKDSVRITKDAAAIAVIKAQQEKRRTDSLNAVKQAEVLAEVMKLREKNKLDSINKALEKEKTPEVAITPEKGEKYEEVATEDGLEPGFYLIANVFGTKKYFEAFMKKLSDEGLQPQSFYRAKNKYNYVYLKRYNSMEEARKARDSKLGGRYPEKTWIYRVVGK